MHLKGLPKKKKNRIKIIRIKAKKKLFLIWFYGHALAMLSYKKMTKFSVIFFSFVVKFINISFWGPGHMESVFLLFLVL